MAKRTLNCAIIGCGDIGIYTADMVKSARNSKMTWFMDVNARLAKDLAVRYAGRWTDSYEEVLADPELHAVVLIVPHHLHAPLAIQAAKAGKHIICHKPLATTVRDARRMVAAAKRAGVSLSCVFTQRLSPPVVEARRLVQRGALGRVFATEVRYLGHKESSYWTGGFSGRVKTDWRTRRETSGGGPLIMNNIYWFDWIHHITGLKPVRVAAEMGTFASPGIEVEDTISVIYRYRGGAIGSAIASCVVPGGLMGDRYPMRIIGTKGQIAFTSNEAFAYFHKKAARYEKGEWIQIGTEKADHQKLFMEATARAILSGKPVPVPGEDAIPALALILKAYESARTGKVLRML